MIDPNGTLCDFQMQMRKALGIDLGDARVGVAVSDDLGMLAHPLETIRVRDGDVAARILQLAAERSAEAIVIGLPRNMDGSFGPAAEKSRAFITSLQSRTTCPVIAWDERLTTVAAQRALREAGKNARDQKQMIDQVAAQVLLQSWLDSQA